MCIERSFWCLVMELNNKFTVFNDGRIVATGLYSRVTEVDNDCLDFDVFDDELPNSIAAGKLFPRDTSEVSADVDVKDTTVAVAPVENSNSFSVFTTINGRHIGVFNLDTDYCYDKNDLQFDVYDAISNTTMAVGKILPKDVSKFVYNSESYSDEQRKIFNSLLRKYTSKFSRGYWKKFVLNLRRMMAIKYDNAMSIKVRDLLLLNPLQSLHQAQQYALNFKPNFGKKTKCQVVTVPTPKAESGVNQEDQLQQEENVIFNDQRNTVEDSGYITTQQLSNLTQVSMPEDQWHVQNVMKKPVPFYSGEWSTTDTLGKILKQWVIPGDTLFGPHYNLVSTFTFFRGHPKIRFQVNGTKFHSGRLLAAFIPAYQFEQYDDKLYSVSNLTSMPHVMLDAAMANSGVLEIPFVHMNTYFNTVSKTRQWQSLGALVLVVFNKLRAATTSSQTVGLTGWVSYENCELHQPCFAHTITLPKTGGNRAVAEAGVEGLVKSAIPMVKDLIAPTLDFGNITGGSNDMDKPTDPIEISRWVPNAVTGLSTGEGLDRSSRLCLVPGSYTIPNADLISTTKDDMDLKEISKIPTRLDLFDWKSSQANGVRLAHIPICPNLFTGYATDSTVKPPSEVITPTLLSYISRMFKFWRGSLRYKIQLIASQMHTGRLLVSFGAGINQSSLTGTFANMSYLNNYVIDLQEKHEIEFEIPFMCERPWLRCDRFRKYDETGKTEVEEFNWENLGYLDIFVLNRLSRPDSVSADIAVNVLISAGDDFTLAVPSDLTAFQAIGQTINSYTEEQRIVAEAMVEQEDVTTRRTTGVVSVIKGPGLVKDSSFETMGENAMNLKTLLRRYTKLYSYDRKRIGDQSNVMVFANTPTIGGVNKCFDNFGVQCRTTLCHFSELFTFWRGSLRYKLVFSVGMGAGDETGEKTSNVTIRVFHVPGVFQYGKFVPTVTNMDQKAMYESMEALGVIVAATGVQNSLEFEVPFYTPYTQLRTIRGGIPNSRSATGLVFITIDPPYYSAPFFGRFDLYQAAGDDFSLNYLRAAPRVQFVSAYDTTRDLTDNAPFIYESVPPTCSQGTYRSFDMTDMRLAISNDKKKEDNKDCVPKAEALCDYIPGVNRVKETVSNLNSASIKVDSVCDTANHLLQQASKKLGFTSSDEEEEEKTTTLLEDASSMLSPLVPCVENLLAYIKLLPTTISDYLQPNMTATDVIIQVSNLVSGFTAFANSTMLIQKICATVTIVSTLIKDITTTMKNNLYHFATSIFENLYGTKKGNEVPQAEGSSFDLIAPLTATFAVALGMIGFKKMPSDKETTDWCRGISEKLRLFNFSSLALTNLQNTWKQMKDLIQWCIDYLLMKMCPHILAQLKLQREFEDIEEWAKFIDSLENIAFQDKIHYDLEFKNKLFRAVDKGHYYNALLLEGKCGRAANIIREYVRKILEISQHCERSKNELPFRRDPFCVAMFGVTDLGKSGCITNAGFDVLDALEYPLHNRWCAINCTEKFFTENYRQQAAVYFDDFSTFTSEEQYQKFFNLKANTAFPLDMAFRKGEYFNSDFIFMTTNDAYPTPNFVTNHDALYRRRDLLIEADWVMTPEVEAALREGRNMKPFRRLDNSHVRFSFRDPKKPDGQPSEWMTYADMVQRVTEEAREHLRVQNEKLNHDLVRAGYIVPRAESLNVRKLCVEACKNSPSLKLFDPDIWGKIEYDGDTKEFMYYAEQDNEEDSYFSDQWEEVKNFFIEAGLDLQDTLYKHSYEVKSNVTLLTRINSGWQAFKEKLNLEVQACKIKYPWIVEVGKWSLYLAAALGSLAILWQGTKAVVHKCACKVIRGYGFRCGLCGRWPKFDNVRPSLKSFMLSQWQMLYGAQPYVDNHVTTIEEESALKSVQQRAQVLVSQPYLGTTCHAESLYSDITKGGGPVRVTAQSNIYGQEVKGATITKVTAQAGEQNINIMSTKKIAESEHTDKLISSRVFPYLYKFRSTGKTGIPGMKINGYVVGQRYVLLNKHFFYGVEEDDLFDVFHNGAWMTIEYHKSQCIDVEGKDLTIYNMPIQFHAHKDNSKHFVSEKELSYFQQGVGSLCKMDSTLRPIQVDQLRISALKELRYELDVAGNSVPIMIQNAWSYPKCSSFGDCGSPLISYSDKLSGKIIGIHVASDPHKSYAQLITREMIQNLIKRKEGTPIPNAEAKMTNLIPQGHLGRIGMAPKGKDFYQSPNTDIIPTKIQGMISTPTTQPSVLSINDERLTKRVNPLKNGIQKYAQTSKPFPERHRKIVNVMMKDEVRKFVRARNPEPLSWDEAVNGIEGIEGYDRLPRNTSPGYPWILTRPKGSAGKDYLFKDDVPVFELQTAIEFRDQKARAFERIESVWIDCLKDERRPIQKVKSGSTRVFNIPPVDFSILMRKYCLDFCVAVKDSRAFMDCKVGLDPQSLEWTTLYYWLAEFSPFCIAGDFSRFDGSMPADLIDDVREDIEEYYTIFGKTCEECKNARIILFDELIHTVHLAKNEFYMTHQGNKSGNPITVILNSRVNKRYMALAWLGLCERLQKWDYYSMSSYQANVRSAIYGDDNLLAIKEEVLSWFNQETIAEYLSEYGITYTDEAKTGVLIKYKSLKECSFLKQTFHDHETLSMIKVPHMSQNTILELLNWTRTSPEQDLLLMDNCNDALRFAYFYGEKYFNQLRDKIYNALNNVDVLPQLNTYMDFHLWFLNTIKFLGDKEATRVN